MITIEVQVSGAKVIVPFHTIIDTKNKPDYMLIIKEEPFIINFELSKGRHSIYINGKNAALAITTITISNNGEVVATKVYDKASAIFYAFNLTI
jgi:hypothetical protein